MNEKEIIEFLRSLLSDKLYGNEPIDFIIEQRFDSYRPDLILKAGKKNIAAIEIKISNTLNKALTNFTTDFYFLFKIRYFIYTDGNTFYFYDRFNNPIEKTKTDSKGFVTRITRRISLDNLRKLKASVSKIFEEQFEKANNQFPKLVDFFQNNSNRISRELKLSSDYALFFEGGKTDVDSFEHQFFIKLLDNEVPNIIYRYCAFNRAFQILNEGTIAMLGLPGMNDTTEPNYIDNYLNDSNDNFWELPPQSIAAINRRFIMSCTIHEDDLMQWRLYGDDAKGACIKFETKSTLKTNHRFYLGRVKYANKNNEHPELLFIKEIIRRVRQEHFFDIKFVLLYVWRHFFKPKEYNYEGEIRLLYIHRKEEREKNWIITDPYTIVNPMVIFDLNKNEFPLRITEVMLGPKRAERQLNKSQIKQMLREIGKTINITESERNVYR
jgi:hypothetical protein